MRLNIALSSTVAAARMNVSKISLFLRRKASKLFVPDCRIRLARLGRYTSLFVFFGTSVYLVAHVIFVIFCFFIRTQIIAEVVHKIDSERA